MQRHFDHIETLVEISEVLTYVRDQAIKAGAARMSYHVTPAFNQQTSRTAAVYAHGFSDEWMALYAKEEFRLTDPIPGRVMEFGSLMTWQDAMSWQPNTPDQEAYFAKMKEYDLVHGFGIPLYGRNNRDAYASFEAHGIKLYAVSYDDQETLREFCEAQSIPYPLLSVIDSAVIFSNVVRIRVKRSLKLVVASCGAGSR